MTQEQDPFDAAVLEAYRSRLGSEPPTFPEVAAAIGWNKSCVRDSVHRLVEAGLLRRRDGFGRWRHRAFEAVPVDAGGVPAFDIDECERRCEMAMKNSHTGRWLAAALAEIRRLRELKGNP